MTLAMGRAYAIVGRDDDGNLLVTAEDPRFVTAITDPANPYKVLAALKLFHDDVADQDVAYLYLPGRVMVAKRPRKAAAGAGIKFKARYYDWDVDATTSRGVDPRRPLGPRSRAWRCSTTTATSPAGCCRWWSTQRRP
jgi:hypothetical protein